MKNSYWLVLFSLTIVGNLFLTSCSAGDSVKKSDLPGKNKAFADSIAKAFGELTVDVPPEKLYDLYNQFCLAHYGAEVDPLVYETLGETLEIKEGSYWEYFSEKSVSISWKTNLPAKTYVEYGTSKTYGEKTEFPERYFYIHLHYLKNLQPNTIYHYRLVSVDERGNKTESQDKTFTTGNIPNAIHIPGDLGNPPYILDQANSVYIVTQDIDADRTAFDIQADNITLDLGGHTVTHGNQLITDLDHTKLEKSGVGIRRKGSQSKQTGLKIYNGIIKQGVAENNTAYYAAEKMVRPDEERKKVLEKNMNKGFSSIELSYCDDVEIAGVTAEYRWHQTWGMRFENAFEKYNIHHNICLDKGTQMFSRHGAGGARSIGFRGSATGDLNHDNNKIEVHHNLIKRTRQNGLNAAQRIYDNEIYVDSWVVNSFAISPHNRNGQVFNNTIFLTGYYACGILWATSDLHAHHNFIHMESISTMIERPHSGRRLIEDWGEQDVLAGMRLTNYNKGGQQRENLTYSNNVIIGRCRGDVEMRGTEFFSDYSIKNLVYKNSIIKIIAEDTLVRKAACVDTQGAFNDRSTHLPLYYKNCSLISNRCNIRFGDEYGQGSNHRFINCKIIKTGNHPHYQTFEFDGHSSVFNHVLLDCEFSGSAKYNDVRWTDTQSLSNYRVEWTLILETASNAIVSISDKKGNEAFSGNTGKDGVISVPLVQSIIRPVEWGPDKEEVEVTNKLQYSEERFSPYTVKVEKDGKQKSQTFLLKEKTDLKIQL
ncbi:MAG: fibronectin type III domain-containing protein [Bacteroidota bacterium]